MLLTLFVVAGLLGLLANGPFIRRSTGPASGAVRVQHQQVTHHEADDSLTLQLGEQTVGTGGGTAIVTVRVTGTWLAGVNVQSISPQPSAERLVPGGRELEFEVAEPGTCRSR